MNRAPPSSNMPDSFGKRQRDQVKARKAAARDDRRIARNKRRKGTTEAPPSWPDMIERGTATDVPGENAVTDPATDR